MNQKSKKLVSKWMPIFLPLLFAFLLCVQWWIKDREYQPNKEQLDTKEKVESYLDKHWISKNKDNSDVVTIPTGMYIQSLKFLNAVDVNVSGYLWQRLNAEKHKDIIKEIESGKLPSNGV